MLDLFSEDITHTLGWTFIHSLWQGCLIGLTLLFALRGISPTRSELRYWVSNLALWLMGCMTIGTFMYYWQQRNPIASLYQWDGIVHNISYVLKTDTINGQKISFTQSLFNNLEAQLPLICQFWLLGALFFVIKTIGGLGFIYYLKKNGASQQSGFLQYYFF